VLIAKEGDGGMSVCRDAGGRRHRGGKREVVAFNGEERHGGREPEWLGTFNGEKVDVVRCSLWWHIMGMQEEEDDVNWVVRGRVG
jgi:hypothetical protein